MRTLGKITITVKADDNDNVHTEHETEFSEELSLMQSAMSEAEKLDAAHMRRDACKKAANFFLAVMSPGNGVKVR